MRASRGSCPTFFILSLVLLCSLLVPPFEKGSFSICLTKLLLGHPCPGCGMTRAFLLLGHGRILEAFSLNPLSLAAYPLTVGLWFGALRRLVRLPQPSHD